MIVNVQMKVMLKRSLFHLQKTKSWRTQLTLTGCLVVLEDKVARKALGYVGLVQNIDENEDCYLKKIGETTFTVKVGDTDLITKDKSIKVIYAVN